MTLTYEDVITRLDVFDKLGDPTDTLVAEAITMVLGLDPVYDHPNGDLRYLNASFGDVLTKLIAKQDITSPEALRRIADAVEAGEVIVWPEHGHWMVTCEKHLYRRLKARWAFSLMFGDANAGPTAADAYLADTSVKQAITMHKVHLGHIVDAAKFGHAIGASPEDTFRLLHPDTEMTAKGSFDPGPAELACRVLHYLAVQRARH
jgi:hypothetical protein